jgi:DNA polymerase elongation subunit (family B)
MIMHLLICQLLGIASATSMQSYQEREKAFWEWQQKQELAQKQRRSTEDKQREERRQRELDAIRRRESFRRVYKTMTAQESEHLAKLERLEAQRNATRAAFAKDHRQVLEYYEKNILPLKKKEYDLVEPKEVQP